MGKDRERAPTPWHPLGERLARARAARGLTRRELADHLQANEETIGLWERGAYRPTRPRLQVLARLLHVPYAELAIFAGYLVGPDSALRSRPRRPWQRR